MKIRTKLFVGGIVWCVPFTFFVLVSKIFVSGDIAEPVLGCGIFFAGCLLLGVPIFLLTDLCMDVAFFKMLKEWKGKSWQEKFKIWEERISTRKEAYRRLCMEGAVCAFWRDPDNWERVAPHLHCSHCDKSKFKVGCKPMSPGHYVYTFICKSCGTILDPKYLRSDVDIYTKEGYFVRGKDPVVD